MKNLLVAFCSALLLSACAGTRVCQTQVATGVVNPRAIYIRPFCVDYAQYRDRCNPNGAVRKSLAPIAFANILQEQLSKLAPAMVLTDDESPVTGWLVEGEIRRIDARNPSCLGIHLRITDVDGCQEPIMACTDGVSGFRVVKADSGAVVYEFDLKGTVCAPRSFGSLTYAALGDGVPVDFRNAAERVMLALSPDPFLYGERNSPEQRN